ncbi:MAG: transposase [Thiolinea sp.]
MKPGTAIKHSTHAYWMWTLVSGLFCLFLTHFSRGKQAAKILLGAFSGYLVTDHYAAYNDYPATNISQLRHLLRHFLKIMSAADKPASLANAYY